MLTSEIFILFLFCFFNFKFFCVLFQQTGHCNLLVDRPPFVVVVVRRRVSGEVANGLGGGGNGMTTGGAPGTLMKANWPRWTSWAIECGSWRDGSPPDWCRCPSMEQLSIALTTCWNRCTTYTHNKRARTISHFLTFFLIKTKFHFDEPKKGKSFGCRGLVKAPENR